MARTEQRVSGTILIDQRRSMEDLVGAKVVEAAIRKLPLSVRQEYESLMPISWCPLSIAHQVIDAVAREAGKTDMLEFHKALVSRGAERTLRGVWRTLLRLTSDEFLTTKTHTFYSKTYEQGKMTSRFPAPGRAELELTGWPDVPNRDMEVIAVGVKRVLEIAGRREVSCVVRRTSDGAFYSVTFQPK
jgi:hypothetical protein